MCRVIIVDDRATNRAIYAQLARSIGQDVVVRAFGDPAGALDWLANNNADLIVTDYDMPGIRGDEFITRFRALPGSGGVPIMMITVCDQRRLRLRALESGATDFLRAPIDHCEFLTRARNLLKLSRSAPPRSGRPCCAPERIPSDRIEEGRRDDFGQETPNLLSQCGDGGYAMHVIEIVPKGAGGDLTAALRRHVRGGDRLVRLDPLRYALLQIPVADSSQARALANRLRAVSASFEEAAAVRIGTALPRAGAGTIRQRAAECLREAIASAAEAPSVPVGVASEQELRLAPVVDLATGELAGAQLIHGDAAAEATDFWALRAGLACVAGMRLAASDSFRISLRLTGEGMEASALRLLHEARAPLSRLDFVVGAGEIAADVGRAAFLVRDLQALGGAMTMDLGELPASDLQDASFWAPLLRVIAEIARPGIRFSCQGAAGLETGTFLRAWAARRLPHPAVLRANGVPSLALLPSLRRAGVALAQGPCFGAALDPRNLPTLLAARAPREVGEIEARRA